MKKSFLIILVFFNITFACCKIFADDKISPTSQAVLQTITIKQRHTETIFTLTVKNNTTANFIQLNNPERLVIDLANTRLSSALPRNIKQDGLVGHIRVGHGPDNSKNLRLVLDLNKPALFSYLIDQNDKKAQQNIQVILVVKPVSTEEQQQQTEQVQEQSQEQRLFEQALNLENISNDGNISKSASLSNEKVKSLISANEQALTPEPQINSQTQISNASFKKVVVVIDPGHGGKDPGASGPDGAKEKNVVLAISKKLSSLLNQQAGIRATLTRKGDYFIPLRGRLTIARKEHANLFMAIHADAFSNEDATGASVFALSSHGATSEAARWLAERENTSELSGISMNGKDHELKSVLLDMSQTATIGDSLRFAKLLLRSIGNITPLHKETVEQAGFVVLKSPDIPSVLVETGFISNPEEEELLTSPDFQTRMAEALCAAIDNYFKQNPPPDTWFEMQYKTG